jgi:hypothetical protein
MGNHWELNTSVVVRAQDINEGDKVHLQRE